MDKETLWFIESPTFYLNVSRLSEVYVDFIIKHINTTSTYTLSW